MAQINRSSPLAGLLLYKSDVYSASSAYDMRHLAAFPNSKAGGAEAGGSVTESGVISPSSSRGRGNKWIIARTNFSSDAISLHFSEGAPPSDDRIRIKFVLSSTTQDFSS